MLLQWLTIVPQVLFYLALLAVPGAALLWGVLNFKGPAAWMFSLPVGAAIPALASVLLPAAGVPWEVWTGPALAAVVSISAVTWRVARGALAGPEEKRPASIDAGLRWSHLGWAGVGTLTFALAYGAAVLPALGGPDVLVTFGDALFHMQGLELLRIGETPSPLDGLPGMYPQLAEPTYYPTLWHVLVLPLGSTVVRATSAATVAVGLVAWPWSLAALAAGLRGGGRLKFLFAPLVAIPLTQAPGVFLFAYGVYPFMLSAVFLAISLGLLGALVRTPSVQLWAALTLATIGAWGAHGTAALTVLAALGAWGLLRGASAVARLWRGRRRALAGSIVALSAALIGVTVAGVTSIKKIKDMANFDRPPIRYRQAALDLVDGTAFMHQASWYVPALILVAATGVLLTLRSRPNQVLAFTTALLVVLDLGAAGRPSLLRTLTAPWWIDPARFATILIMMCAAFAAVTLGLIQRWAAKRWRWKPVVVGTISAVAAFGVSLLDPLGSRGPLDFEIYESVGRDPDTRVGITQDEIDLLESLDDVLPPGTVVTGDPDSGAAWVSIYSDSLAYQASRKPRTADERYLAAHFNEILTDPKVCEIVDKHNIGAFIISDSPSTQWADYYGGYNSTDTSTGFRLIEQIGGARLYEVTACD